jgi:hypothetical protein
MQSLLKILHGRGFQRGATSAKSGEGMKRPAPNQVVDYRKQSTFFRPYQN